MRARVFNSNSTTDFTYIWSLTGNQGNVWKNVTVDIGQLPAGYKVDVCKYWLLSVSHVSVCITCFCLYHMFLSVSHVSACISCFCLYHMFLSVSHVSVCITCFRLYHMFLSVSHVSVCITCFCLYHMLLSVSHVSVCITCFCLYHMFPSVSHASVCITCFCLYHMFLACISLLAPISSIGLWFMERCDPLMHSNKGYDNTDPKSLCSIIIKHLRQKRVFFKSTVLMKRIQLLYSLCVVSISIIQTNKQLILAITLF